MTDDQHLPACRCHGGLSRRHALAGVAAVGLTPVLAACGGDDPAETANDPGASSTPGGSSSADGGGSAGGLTTTSEVPVGGGVILADQKVVVTQPTEGEFLAFSATCTHQGCAVGSVEDGSIVCPCHNSFFSIEDGAPTGGPASAPLAPVEITVEGDSISLA